MIPLDTILEQAVEFETQLPAFIEAAALPQGKALASWIDHTLLKPEATSAQIEQLCQEALQYSFAAVCINPAYVSQSARHLDGSAVKVCTVVGFPLGAAMTTSKVLETYACLDAGAQEIDMVLNVGAIKSQAYGLALDDIQGVVQAAHHRRAIVKVILENALLTRHEKILACLLCQAAGAEEFGSMHEARPILQKGDNFRVPGEAAAKRYVAETFRAQNAVANPRVEWIRKPLDD